MFHYPIVLTRDDNATWLATCRDVPEMVTYGEPQAAALDHAVDALITVLAARIRDRKPIPPPSPARRREHVVTLPVLVALKLALYEAMRATGTRKSDLARQLTLHPTQADRLLSLHHATAISTVERALALLGRTVAVTVMATADRDNPELTADEMARFRPLAEFPDIARRFRGPQKTPGNRPDRHRQSP